MPDRSDPHTKPTDPLRTLQLMWEPTVPPSRGPKPKIALEQIVTASVALADRNGLEAISMRKVAAELGVGTMSLYTYITSKSELIELMVNAVFGELQLPDPGLGWRERITGIATQSWDLYHRHPWTLQVNLERLALGPHLLDAREALYAALESLGLAGAQLYGTALLIDAYVQGAARNAIAEAQSAQASGQSTDEYFAARADFWERYFDVQRYPVHTRIWNSGGFDLSESTFSFGLSRLLDGIEALSSTRR
ncbi:AcrR family transcriptional regulator [Deinobacterium chartae]|uniref:AcrR family transcriptional regulator n=1 Tax=Deinobacterium chartae TaxID=521158 RepID=A0A841I3D0_9DEIO|nr:TetR/AcrR family transcriptional regulator [Deinobacterium chartae]MBB6099534.1 AcrR family transcriptional regulator [Deinobacterium chartae]